MSPARDEPLHTVEPVPDDAIRKERVGDYFRGDLDGLLVMLRNSFDIEA
jgi:hypothetical protein